MRQLLTHTGSCCLLLAALARGQEPPGPLTGQVLDLCGEPVPAATVIAVDARGQVRGRSATDAEGVYRIGRVLPDGVQLQFSAAGRVRRVLGWRGPATPTRRNVVLEDACSLGGRVTDDTGRAVVDACVLLMHDRDTLQTRTDGDGRFVFEGVPMQQVTLRAWHRDGVGSARATLRGDHRQDLVLDRRAVNCDVVVHGTPPHTTGAFVRAFGPTMALLPNGGRCELTGPDERLTAMLTVERRADLLLEPHVPNSRTTPDARYVAAVQTVEAAFRVRAAPERTLLTGRLHTSRGQPVGAIEVLICDLSGPLLARVTCDTNGEFRTAIPLPRDRPLCLGVRLGPWHLVDDERRLRDGHCWITWYAPHLPLSLAVDPTGRIDAIVAGPDGAPMPFGDVHVADPEQPFRELLHTTLDSAGRWRCELPPAAYEVLVVAQNGRVVRGAVQVAANGIATAQWRAVPCGEVAGTLRDDSGLPLPGIEIRLVRAEALAGAPLIVHERQVITVRTDRHGRFRGRGLPTGDWVAATAVSERAESIAFSIVAEQTTTLNVTVTAP